MVKLSDVNFTIRFTHVPCEGSELHRIAVVGVDPRGAIEAVAFECSVCKRVVTSMDKDFGHKFYANNKALR